MKNPTLEQVMDELGITARAEARGEVRGEGRGEARAKRQVARKLIRKGWSREEIAETAGLDLAEVESLYETAEV